MVFFALPSTVLKVKIKGRGIRRIAIFKDEVDSKRKRRYQTLSCLLILLFVFFSYPTLPKEECFEAEANQEIEENCLHLWMVGG